MTTTVTERLRDLHFRRAGDWLKDGQSFGQTTWADQCDHCMVDWPCATVAILDVADRVTTKGQP